MNRFPSTAKWCLAMAAAAATGIVAAQPRPEPVPPRGAVAPLAAAPAATAQDRVDGRLQRWLVNPNGEADGLLLDNGTQVAFPPHLSAPLTAALKPGDTLRITGWRAGGGTPVLRAVQIRTGERLVVDDSAGPAAMPPPPPRPAPALAQMEAGGRIARVLFNDRAEPHGVLLEDGTTVRFAPHVGRRVAALLQPGAPLHASGWGSRSALGAALEATRLGSTAQSMQDLFSGPAAPAPHVPGV